MSRLIHIVVDILRPGGNFRQTYLMTEAQIEAQIAL